MLMFPVSMAASDFIYFKYHYETSQGFRVTIVTLIVILIYFFVGWKLFEPVNKEK